MSPAIAALLAAALVAGNPGEAAPRPEGENTGQVVPLDELALGALPADMLEDVILEALPPPPTIVERKTTYYGVVMINHRAHLARRAACKTCHGTGSITKITFTPKVAHERCVGCHQQQEKGPTDCQGCHIKPPPPPPAPIVVAKAEAPPPPPPEPDPAHLSAAFAAFDSPETQVRMEKTYQPFHRWFQVGFAGGDGAGLGVRLASHQNYVVITQSVERLSSSNNARTFGLFGVGMSRPIRARFAWEAVALGGFDAVEKPGLTVLPALGARAGVSWQTGIPVIQQLSASITGAYDLMTRTTPMQETIGGFTLYGTVATGFKISPK